MGGVVKPVWVGAADLDVVGSVSHECPGQVRSEIHFQSVFGQLLQLLVMSLGSWRAARGREILELVSRSKKHLNVHKALTPISKKVCPSLPPSPHSRAFIFGFRLKMTRLLHNLSFSKMEWTTPLFHRSPPSTTPINRRTRKHWFIAAGNGCASF